MNSITSISPSINTALVSPNMSVPETTQGSFIDALQQQIEQTNQLQTNSTESIQAVEEGTGSINDAMIAMQKASLSFQTTKTVMNKMVSAYQDIMNTQI